MIYALMENYVMYIFCNYFLVLSSTVFLIVITVVFGFINVCINYDDISMTVNWYVQNTFEQVYDKLAS